MSSNPEKYNFQNGIKSFEVDAFGRISLPNILYYFQEAANHHATELDWGMEYLDSMDKFWVLSRLKLQVDEYPHHKDLISVNTWSRGATGFIAYRDFQILKDAKIVIRATSSWMILDKSNHRPCKIDQLGKPVPGIDLGAIPFPESKIPSLQNQKFLLEKRILFSDIDINQHVNNGKYMEMYIDALSDQLMNSAIIEEVDILYMQESQYNNVVIVNQEISEKDTHHISLNMVRSSDQKEISRCKIKFKY